MSPNMQLENFFQRLQIINQSFKIVVQSDIYFLGIQCKTSYKFKMIYVDTNAIAKNIPFRLNEDTNIIYGKTINKKYF